MTKLRLEDVRCAACGHHSEQPVLASTNSSGAPDLVLRVELLRRADQADEAGALAAEVRPRVREAYLRKMRDYEDALIGRGDIGCHTLAEAGAATR
ncbi:MAG TPA: hypothetical protein VF265_02680 [Nevskiaceae bacterium]